MSLVYDGIPALVLIVCLIETYRYLGSNYLGKWYRDVKGVTRRHSVWWFTLQDRHIRLAARTIASLTALVIGIIVWRKLSVGSPTDLPLIFSVNGTGWTLAISTAVTIHLWIITKCVTENISWWFDLFFLLLAATFPFLANSLLFAIIYAVA
jgi:hypothetical protein